MRQFDLCQVMRSRSSSFLSATVRGSLIACILVTTFSHAHGNEIHDLAGDWSNASNPNGPWSYNIARGVPMANLVNDYLGAGTMQPAWAPGPAPNGPRLPSGSIAAFWKAIADATPASGDDVKAGRVMVHGNDPFNSAPGFEDSIANITFVFPTDGMATVTGDTWLASKALGRTEQWTLLHNGSVLTSGLIRPTDPFTSSSPESFASGSGGASSLTFPVSAGDKFEFDFVRSPGEAATLIGTDLHIVVVPPVPEPSSMTLLGGAAAGASLFAAIRSRSRRQAARAALKRKETTGAG